jgi:hypothetical protein
VTPPIARAIVVAAAVAAVVIAALGALNGATTARARPRELHFRYVYSPDA